MEEHEIIGQQGEGSGSNYRAFLLRCWKEGEDSSIGREDWRVILVQVGEEAGKRCFSCLEDFFSFLKTELESDQK